MEHGRIKTENEMRGERMLKKRFLITLVIALALSIGVFALFQGNDQTVKANGNDAQHREMDRKTKEEEQAEQPNSEAREKLDEMTDEEIKDLLHKGDQANKGEAEVTDEEVDMLKSITPDKYYNLMGMTDDEVLNYIDGYHAYINTTIMLFHEEAEEYSEEFLPGRAEFEWIKENYPFEKEYDKELINEILNLRDEFMEGNQDALFSLKYVLYELNAAINPESIEESRAYDLSLSNVVRIQNGREPIDEDE